MKAYKCPKCGYLHNYIPIYCIDCNEYVNGIIEKVEIIDWEEELLTKTE